MGVTSSAMRDHCGIIISLMNSALYIRPTESSSHYHPIVWNETQQNQPVIGAVSGVNLSACDEPQRYGDGFKHTASNADAQDSMTAMVLRTCGILYYIGHGVAGISQVEQLEGSRRHNKEWIRNADHDPMAVHGTALLAGGASLQGR